MERARVRQYSRDPRFQLAAYLVVLALIALWPSPVDAGARPVLGAITRTLPWATYARIEFGANILLFVPLGMLLATILPMSRYLVLPLSVVSTVAIESAQALLLSRRVPSVLDIIANVTGASVGLIVVVVLEARRRRLSAAGLDAAKFGARKRASTAEGAVASAGWLRPADLSQRPALIGDVLVPPRPPLPARRPPVPAPQPPVPAARQDRPSSP